MKRWDFITFILFTAAILGHADIYIKERVHADAFYDIGTVFPAVTTERELWIGETGLTYRTPRMTVIIDKNKNLISILNRKAKTYVESSLPLDMSRIVSQDLFLRLQGSQIDGIVKRTEGTKRIGQKNCDLHEITIESPYPKEINVWATPDVPFDWRKNQEMRSNIWILSNYNVDFIRMLETIKGYWMMTQERRWMDGTEEKEENKVLEIAEKNPPHAVYSIAAGYTKVDKLSLQDFRDLGIAIYTHEELFQLCFRSRYDPCGHL